MIPLLFLWSQKQLKSKCNYLIYALNFKIVFYSQTKELLDEALDSVKNVLMQTFKKNLESGGDLKYLFSFQITHLFLFCLVL
jgi:FixJ family two-component response regulator